MKPLRCLFGSHLWSPVGLTMEANTRRIEICGRCHKARYAPLSWGKQFRISEPPPTTLQEKSAQYYNAIGRQQNCEPVFFEYNKGTGKWKMVMP